jgi:hypothetical protein
MAKVTSTVVKPEYVVIDFDISKCDDDEYVNIKRQEIRDAASLILNCDASEVIIHGSELPALVEE